MHHRYTVTRVVSLVGAGGLLVVVTQCLLLQCLLIDVVINNGDDDDEQCPFFLLCFCSQQTAFGRLVIRHPTAYYADGARPCLCHAALPTDVIGAHNSPVDNSTNRLYIDSQSGLFYFNWNIHQGTIALAVGSVLRGTILNDIIFIGC